MKRNRHPRRTRQTPDTELLLRLASRLGQSSNRIEDAWWEARLAAHVDHLLADGAEEALVTVLDQLYSSGSRAYDELADMVESCAETRRAESASGLDVVLIAAPLLAWSRFQIPSGSIPQVQLDAVRVHLQAHVLAADARLALVDVLYSPDQLPQNYVETAQLAERLARAAIHGRNLKVDSAQLQETMSFLSDTRYVLGAVAAPHGAALFRWQEDDGDPAESFRQWAQQGGEALRPLLPACAVEFLPVLAYHAAVRDADRASRPWSLRAAVAFLQTVLNLPGAELRAVVAPFHDRQLEEYRVGFTRRGDSDVLHGVVWPLLESEDENNDAPTQIEATLREAGIGSVLALDQRFPLEFCDDCGAPLYPNPEGEPVHAEMPEEQGEAAPRHLH
ncbi:DUF2863 family protein [Sulfuritalea sp.]|uniref:DUF2863 family protein n=1 Tax=Sulfuritalea sp. TaxID=2480090 RepID=UPI001AC4C523|nr:DUF2863 family protein [Sulfuritalea sp.]MBN8474721.1 DUF2863 family protein [Sulfuritalea sp.]